VPERKNLRAVGDRIEQLLDELRAAADRRVYGQAEELLGLVTDLYGGGLARVIDILERHDPGLVRELAGDELVASLLLVHGLHPDDLVVRVTRALDSVRPLLASHGGDVELLDIDPAASAVHLNLLGSCHGCPSSTVTLRMAVETAIAEAAPEILVIDVEQPTADAESGAGLGAVGAPTNGARGGGGVPISLGKKPQYDECPAELVTQR
jgi:Fe-S cluster biogenesis protein NfuA